MKKKATPSKDPAVIALNRVMAARENDEKYLAAIVELETCAALTAQGVRAKRNLERSRLAALEQGDRLTAEGRIMMQRLADTIDEGLERLTRAGMRTRRARPSPTPARSPPLGAGRPLAVQRPQNRSAKFQFFEKFRDRMFWQLRRHRRPNHAQFP